MLSKTTIVITLFIALRLTTIMSGDSKKPQEQGPSGVAFSQEQQEQWKSLMASTVTGALAAHSKEQPKQTVVSSKTGEQQCRLGLTAGGKVVCGRHMTTVITQCVAPSRYRRNSAGGVAPVKSAKRDGVSAPR